MSGRTVEWWAAFTARPAALYGTGLSREDALDEGRSVAMTLGCDMETIQALDVARCSTDLAEAVAANTDARNLFWVCVMMPLGPTCGAERVLVLRSQFHPLQSWSLPT